MRWVLDIIAVLTAAGLILAVLAFNREEGKTESQVTTAAAGVRRIELEIKYRAVTKSTTLNEFGWPATVDPAWFDNNEPPRNTLVSPNRPWLEIAGPGEAKLMNPLVRMTVDESLAGFWYNPYEGIVRARVPVMLSDTEAVDLYNRVNTSSLRSVFEREGSASTAGAGHELVERGLVDPLARPGAAPTAPAAPAATPPPQMPAVSPPGSPRPGPTAARPGVAPR